MSQHFTLVSHHLCPYVQRAAIAMTEKGVSFERRYVDLANKPRWFLEISPLGKVPVLLVDKKAIFESVAILEYLEEVCPNRLHPSDPLERAEHRAWIEFGSSILNDIAALYNAKDKVMFTTKSKKITEKFTQIESRLEWAPFFTGERLCLVDAVFGPVFRYFDVLDDFFDEDVFAGMPRLLSWRAALKERPSIKKAVPADYNARLRGFLVARQSHLSRRIETCLQSEAV